MTQEEKNKIQGHSNGGMMIITIMVLTLCLVIGNAWPLLGTVFMIGDFLDRKLFLNRRL